MALYTNFANDKMHQQRVKGDICATSFFGAQNDVKV